MIGYEECNRSLGLIRPGKEPNRSGTCGEGHRGAAVGKFFVVLDDGTVEFCPEGETVLRWSFSDKPTWKRVQEGHTVYNTQHLWCCDDCLVSKSAPGAYDAPRSAFMYPMCVDDVPTCDGLFLENVGHPGGTCVPPLIGGFQ